MSALNHSDCLALDEKRHVFIFLLNDLQDPIRSHKNIAWNMRTTPLRSWQSMTPIYDHNLVASDGVINLFVFVLRQLSAHRSFGFFE